MFTDQSVNQFLDALASSEPTPGGGSGSALGGALGAALVSMVCNLTIGKKGYEEAEERLREVLADSEAIRRALIFVSRCQNLETEHNTTPFASKNPDGGFYYTPAAGGTSQAGETPQGGLRSYGSMTYAGLKSMIYAGVEPDDPRVKAAIEWIGKNYDLETNPGMGSAGLYYYYHTFAKALAAIDQPTFVDQDGTRHHWRAELAEVLIEQQRPDGSWINGNERWLEGDPNLVTAYALMSLAYCREP